MTKNLETKPIAALGLKADCSVRLPTDYGEFTLNLYLDSNTGKEHLALIAGPLDLALPVTVRIHSECLTGDIFSSRRCDCGSQLQNALAMLAAGTGVLVYLRQEGRGIGLLEKLKAYTLQDKGFDTVEANQMLGHDADARDYNIAYKILLGLGVTSIDLITNNPDKMESMEKEGIKVNKRIAIPVSAHVDNEKYLQTKIEKFRHLIELEYQTKKPQDR